MYKLLSKAVATLAMVVILASGGCQTLLGANKATEKEAYGVMDTDVSIKGYGRKASAAIDAAIEEMRRLDGILSSYSPDSEIAQVNLWAGVKPVKVSAEALAVVKRALYFGEISDGSFDPTIFPVMRLWGFGGPQFRVPADDEIKAVLSLVDYRRVHVDEAQSTVYLEEKGMALDLGAIAKGYAVDRMAGIMRSQGVTSFIINVGGNVYAQGAKPDKTKWNVAVTDPRNPEDYMGYVHAQDIAIVSSGDYERYFEEGGLRYHHIVDPKTGYPSRTCRGTTVLLPSSTDADGLSTTLFILGPEATNVLSRFPGVGAIFVLPDGKITTKGLVDNFEFK